MTEKNENLRLQERLKEFRNAFPNSDDFSVENIDNKHVRILNRLKNEGGIDSINLGNLRNWSMQSDMGTSRMFYIKLPLSLKALEKLLNLLLGNLYLNFRSKSMKKSINDDINFLKLKNSYDVLLENPVSKTPGITQWFTDGRTTYNLRWIRYVYLMGRIKEESLLNNDATWVDIGSFYGGLQSISYRYFPNVKYVMVDFHHQLFRSYLYLTEMYPDSKHIFGGKNVLDSKGAAFCYVPVEEFHEINQINCDLLSNFFSFGEMKREYFNTYLNSKTLLDAKIIYNVNRFVSSPFFEPTYDSDLTLLDYKFENHKISYLDVFPIHHFQTIKRELLGIKRHRNTSSSYFEMISRKM